MLTGTISEDNLIVKEKPPTFEGQRFSYLLNEI